MPAAWFVENYILIVFTYLRQGIHAFAPTKVDSP